jgi:hypothetical protein
MIREPTPMGTVAFDAIPIQLSAVKTAARYGRWFSMSVRGAGLYAPRSPAIPIAPLHPYTF